MGLAHLIKKVIFGHRVDSETYIKYLRSIGMSIGERTVIYEPRASYIDVTRPFLIKIGNDVKITRGVTMLTHGYDWSVLAGLHDVVLGSGGYYGWKQCVYRYEYNYTQRCPHRE